MSRKTISRDMRQIDAPAIQFMDAIPVENAKPGDIVWFWSDRGYRHGDVVGSKRTPDGFFAVRERQLSQLKQGPVQFVPLRSVQWAYRYVEL